MPIISFLTSNTTGLTNSSLVSVLGRNGFSGRAGCIKLLVNSDPTKVDISGSTSNISFTINNLDQAFDDNFYKHILDVNDGSFLGLKGDTYATIPVIEKTGTGGLDGFVGFNTDKAELAFPILDYDLVNNTIKIENATTNGVELINVLDSIPFYICINQIIDTRFFANNWLYVEGLNKQYEKRYNVDGQVGSNTFSLGITPKDKGFISLFVDEEQQSLTSFSFTPNTSQITYSVPTGSKSLRTLVSHYTVPIIEVGDNVQASVGLDNVYPISASTFDTNSPSYNAQLTANSIFKVKLSSNIRANLSGIFVTNISSDLLRGTINNLDSANNTFTVDYSNTDFIGQFNLSNYKVYSLTSTLGFNHISLGSSGLISDVPFGVNFVRARSINSTGRKSPFVTKSIRFKDYLIGKVGSININEQLYKDTSLGVVINIEIEFVPISGQDITHYEIGYKIISTEETSASGSFNTVEIPAESVESDGKIRYTINNIERGRTSDVNSITVQIIPVSSTNRKGIPTLKTQNIVGKTAAPSNVINVSGGQAGSNLLFTWDILTNSDGSFVDIDLLEIEIRRATGIIPSASLSSEWIQGKSITKIAAPASSVIVPIRNYGTFTYMFKTRDTSGNYSDTVVGFTITTTRPVSDTVFKRYSESTPSGNVVFGYPNDNASENNYPSFNDSNNFGINETWTSFVDNANGTSSGFSSITEPTDLFAGANATYQCQIRDLGNELTATILSSVDGSQFTRTTFNDFRSNVIDSTSDTGTNNTVLVDSSNGGIGAYLTSATYNVQLGTLTSGGPTGNIFAIWNGGQFANDSANSNSFAYIAGVINSNAIILAETFFANGERTFSNSLSNLSSNTKFQLIDLTQFDDNSEDLFFEGKDRLVTIEEEYRLTTLDPFYSNGNVNSAVFVTSDSDNEGWRTYSPTSQSFRWFQMRYNIINQDPQQADYVIDNMDYTVEVPKKSFSTEINVTANPTTVDYSPIQFKRPPTITLTANSTLGVTPTYSNVIVNTAEVRTFLTSNGDPITGVLVSFKAEGI